MHSSTDYVFDGSAASPYAINSPRRPINAYGRSTARGESLIELAANVLVNAITLPLAMLGGSFFPFEAMPEWMASLGRLTPNGWALLRLRAVMDGAPEPGVLGASMAAAVGLALALGWIVSRRLRGWAA